MSIAPISRTSPPKYLHANPWPNSWIAITVRPVTQKVAKNPRLHEPGWYIARSAERNASCRLKTIPKYATKSTIEIAMNGAEKKNPSRGVHLLTPSFGAPTAHRIGTHVHQKR